AASALRSDEAPRSAAEAPAPTKLRRPNNLGALKCHHTGPEVIHGADDLNRTRLLQFLQDRAAASNVLHPEPDVGRRDRVDIRRILARHLTLELRRRDCRLDSSEQSRKVSHLDIVDGAFDGAARGMSKEQDHFRAGDGARKLEAAEEVVVDNVPCDARVEHLADPRIENDLSRRAGVDAPQRRNRRELTSGAGALLISVVSGDRAPCPKSLVALLQL